MGRYTPPDVASRRVLSKLGMSSYVSVRNKCIICVSFVKKGFSLLFCKLTIFVHSYLFIGV